MKSLALLLSLLLLPCLSACGGGDDDDSAPPAPEVPDFVEGLFRLTDLTTGEFVVDAPVTFDGSEELSNADGRARHTVPSQTPFAIEVAAPDSPAHRVEGLAGVTNFQYSVELTTSAALQESLLALGLAPDAGRGTLVVKLNTVALQAATGGSASIDAASDPAFISVSGEVLAGSELIFEASDRITFPNVEPGPVQVSLISPESDSCLNAPALDAVLDVDTFTVEADTVTVVTYICQ